MTGKGFASPALMGQAVGEQNDELSNLDGQPAHEPLGQEFGKDYLEGYDQSVGQKVSRDFLLFEIRI